MSNEKKEIVLILSPEHVQNILNVLAKMPYEQSFEMIETIREQSNNQPKPKPKAEQKSKTLKPVKD